MNDRVLIVKKCKKCGQEKSSKDFRPNKRSKTGSEAVCFDCVLKAKGLKKEFFGDTDIVMLDFSKIDIDIFGKIKQMAKDEFRSVEFQIFYILKKAIGNGKDKNNVSS